MEQAVTTQYITLPTITQSVTTVVQAVSTATEIETSTAIIAVPTTISAPYVIAVSDYETGVSYGYLTQSWQTWPGDKQYAWKFDYNVTEKALRYWSSGYYCSIRYDSGSFLQTADWWFALTNNKPVQFDVNGTTGVLSYQGSDKFICGGPSGQMTVVESSEWASPQVPCRIAFANL